MRRGLLIAAAAFAAGYLAGWTGRPASREAHRAPATAVPAARGAAPHARGPGDAAPTETARGRVVQPEVEIVRYTVDETRFVDADDFVEWYRVHRAALGLPVRSFEWLTGFGVRIVKPLCRIPRPELLRRLIPIHGAWLERDYPARPGEGWGTYRVRTALALFQRLDGHLATSDLVLMRTSAEWDTELDEAGYEPSPRPDAPAGADPYATPDSWGTDGFGRWYAAYRADLDLPTVPADSVEYFGSYAVSPLGRIPEPGLLRELLLRFDAYRVAHREARRAYDAAPQDSELEARSRRGMEDLTRDLFRDLRRLLDPIDYERMRRSDAWESECLDVGILGEDE